MTTIRKVGDEYMIPLDDDIMKRLKVREGDQVRLAAKDGVLECSFLRVGLTDAEIDAAMEHIRARYGAALKRLAE